MVTSEGGATKSEMDASSLVTAYDFIVVAENGIPNIMLQYENIGIQPNANDLDEKSYFDQMMALLLSMEQMKYEAIEASNVKAAGEEWYKGTVSLLDGAAYQDFYFKKADKIMVILCTTYTAETKSIANKLIEAINKIK